MLEVGCTISTSFGPIWNKDIYNKIYTAERLCCHTLKIVAQSALREGWPCFAISLWWMLHCDFFFSLTTFFRLWELGEVGLSFVRKPSQKLAMGLNMENRHWVIDPRLNMSAECLQRMAALISFNQGNSKWNSSM